MDKFLIIGSTGTVTTATSYTDLMKQAEEAIDNR